MNLVLGVTIIYSNVVEVISKNCKNAWQKLLKLPKFKQKLDTIKPLIEVH